MQEQKAGKIRNFLKKIKWMNLIFLTGCAGVILIAAGAVLYGYRNLPTASWRESHTDFPIRGVGLAIDELKAEWKSSKGNKRLELRTAYYPEATITLQSGKGSGRLFIRFCNPSGVHVGDIISVPYREGQFVKNNDVMFNAEGTSAQVRLESGYSDKSDYMLHRLNEEESLWRVQVWQQPSEQRTTYYLGYATITPIAD